VALRRRGAEQGANGIRSSRRNVAVLVGGRPVSRPRKLNLHCLLGGITYLTQTEKRGFALRLKNASGCGPC